MAHENAQQKQYAGKLEIIPAVVFVAFILLGLAAAASAATTKDTRDGATSETSRGPLPVRVAVPSSPEGDTTGWDIDGDGRPDMVQVRRGNGPDGHVETAYDFDADGKPDFVRGSGTAQPGQDPSGTFFPSSDIP
jgi:hypothetical protein